VQYSLGLKNHDLLIMGQQQKIDHYIPEQETFCRHLEQIQAAIGKELQR